MIIAVPSKGRAGKCRTIKFLGSAAVLFVPSVEVEAYVASYPVTRVVGVPMTVRGITPTRNWILEYAEGDDVVFADDDLIRQGWMRLNDETAKHASLTVDEWVGEMVKLFDLTRSLGYRIWGVATAGATRAVYPWRPFLWQSYVTASCMGVVTDSGIRFDESFIVKEDYELTCRCIAEDGGVVAARYLHWDNSHWGDDGGCKDYRTQDIERDAIQRLLQMYPGMLRQVERGGSEWSIELVI